VSALDSRRSRAPSQEIHGNIVAADPAPSESTARNLKLVLVAFEKLSGLKINFHKNELFCFGGAKDRGKEYVELFG
jgi:hypothetical protein